MSNLQDILWVEKYRPKKVEDCILPSDIKSALKGFVETKNLPNLILGGPAGTGKTTVARALCEELGYEYLFINGSTERNIDVLRTTVTQFASSISLTSDMKVVIIDEADGLNPQSTQPGLRAFIEEFHSSCRFIFTCNYPGKLIPALHSRCSVFDFTVKGKDKAEVGATFYKRVAGILKNESVEFERSALQSIVLKFFPDFRRTINELQRASKLNGKIDDTVQTTFDSIDVNDYVKALKDKDFRTAKKWIVESLAVADQNVIFRKIYDGLYDLVQPQSIPQAILLIANYQYKSMFVVDQEINFASFTIELMTDITWK